MVNYGYIKDIHSYPEANRRVMKRSCHLLKGFFERNSRMLKTTGKSVVNQVKELEAIYGLKVSANFIYQLKAGKRFKTGFMLLTTIQEWWMLKGYPFPFED